MLVNVLNICSDDELMEPTDPESIGDLMPHQPTEEQILEFRKKEERRIALQKKILAVAKMAKYFHTLREESETGLYFMSFAGKLLNGTQIPGLSELKAWQSQLVSPFYKSCKDREVNRIF